MEGDGSLDLSLAAVVGDTETRAAIDLEVVVEGTIVALLTVGSVDDTITTEGNSAVGSAGVGAGVGVLGTVVTLLKEVDNTITTERKFAVEATVVGGVGVGSTQVALLSGFEVAVTAFTSASGVTTIEGKVVAIVTGLTTVHDTITASGESAVESASILDGVGVEATLVTELTGVEDAITTDGAEAVGSAAVGEVGVVAAMVAFLRGVERFQTTSAHLDASL